MAKHPQLQEAREGMAIKIHCCAPELPVPTTSHTAALLQHCGAGTKHCASTGASSAPCPGLAVSTTAWDTSGQSLCRVETCACIHQPFLFSALNKPNNLPEANFSHDAGQEALELHLPALGKAGQGGSPGHDLYSAQPIFGKAGCGLQGVDLSHLHIAQ